MATAEHITLFPKLTWRSAERESDIKEEVGREEEEQSRRRRWWRRWARAVQELLSPFSAPNPDPIDYSLRSSSPLALLWLNRFMAPEREMPFVSASLLPPPNQNDTFLAATDADRFPSFSSQGFFSAAVDCSNSDIYLAATAKSGTAGSSSLSTAFQAEQSSLDLYVPQCEDEAELEWLSRFLEESSFCDVPDIAPPRSCAAERTDIGRGARSKRRPRSAASASSALSSPSSSSSSSSEFSSDGSGRRKKGSGSGGAVPRRCTHCESEKTPQWRTGPLGPKTLCNACGVRYKSGRLVPEYRPAASPTFVLTQHSNSHRKVMELRRQKELFLLPRPQHSDSDASSAAQPVILFDGDGGGGVCCPSLCPPW